jgi:hypothetical protein
MKLLKNGVHNLSDNKIYRECYHGIVSIANGGPHIRMNVKNIGKRYMTHLEHGLDFGMVIKT